MILAGCNIKLDDNYTGLGKEALPGSPLNPREEGGACVCNNQCECNCEGTTTTVPDDVGDLPGPEEMTGNSWRFTSMNIRDSLLLPETGDDTMAQTLNEFIGPEIEAGNINVIVLVDVHDEEAGTVSIRIGGGEADGDGFKYSEDPAQLVLGLAGLQFSTVEFDRLKFPVDNLTPPYLPLSELDLTGQFNSDGTAIAQGVLEGFLTMEDAATVEIFGTLDSVLIGAGIPPDTDLDGDGEEDAWRILADFTVASVQYTGD